MAILTKHAAQQELDKRKNKALAFVLEDVLFPEQLAFVQDPAPFKTGCCSRRSGKTIACAADLIKTAHDNQAVVCLYITLSRNNAKKIIWSELKKLNRKYKLGGTANESDLSMTFPNDSIIYCSGASDRSEIEKFRGLALKICYIDETQSFPSYIEDLIDEVIAPALLDHGGTLALIGTPGPLPSGFFYGCTRSLEWSHHSWTFFQNPFILEKSGLTHNELLTRELKRRGVTVDHPSVQREFFGKWVLDSDSLVFHYNEAINDYVDLPKGQYTYILGADIGYKDADALALLAWSETSKVTYLIEEMITRRQGIDELAAQIQVLQAKYDISKIVIDAGALGKKIQESIISRYQIPLVAAEKQRKFEYIELMNAALRTGALKAKKESRFAQDCQLVEYDLDRSTPDKRVVSSRYHSDITDAALYAWRESYAFTFVQPKEGPKWGTRAYQDAQQASHWDLAMEHYQAEEDRKKGPWGES